MFVRNVARRLGIAPGLVTASHIHSSRMSLSDCSTWLESTNADFFDDFHH